MDTGPLTATLLPLRGEQGAFAFEPEEVNDRVKLGPFASGVETRTRTEATTADDGRSALASDDEADEATADLEPPALRPESLHPSLWFGHQLARTTDAVIETGFAALDAQLPGGGWPRRALTELLLQQPGIGEMRLVAPSLVATQKSGRLVMLFDPPVALSATALERLGLHVPELLVIHTRARVIPGTDTLWALEQALKSGHVGAVLAWLPPRLRAERLRRLQLAAHAHDGPAFVFGEPAAAQRPTAAPLRLALKPAAPDALQVRILKRRGPLLEKPIRLSLPPVLSHLARERVQEEEAARRPRSDLNEATFVDLAQSERALALPRPS